VITADSSTRAAEAPEGFTVETLATNLNAATALAVAPDGRIFIADQTGPLRVWKNGRLLATPALDLTGRVDDYWERGLIGVTLPPDFPHTPHLFVVYVAKEPFTHHVVSRFTMLGDRADPASELVLLKGDDQGTLGGKVPHGHQGGPLRFGPDGRLYIGLGEQTAGEPAQLLTTLQGKILRLNPDGTIPADNPFYTLTTGKYRAIWATGIRNPFGLAFQPETGRLFESDVGQSSWEEVNDIVRGANYGWPQAEGMSTNAAFTNPLHVYPPAIGRSIVGAAFYPKFPGAAGVGRLKSVSDRGAQSQSAPSAVSSCFPEKWRGKFFFADWAANWVKALDAEAPTNVVTFAKGFNGPVALEVAPDGSLLVLNRGTIWRDGRKWQANSGSLVRIRHRGTTPDLAREREPRPALPRTLAAAKVFTSLAPLTPRTSFVEFQINAPPWQPGVAARRWISLPAGARLAINADGEFEFPPGAVVVQHHVIGKTGAPFETQVLWLTGPRTARAAAYRWNTDGRDATLVEEGEVITLPGDAAHRWFSPGAEEYLNLDTLVVGFLLPVSPRQLQREDQLVKWRDRGWFDPALDARRLAAIPRLAALSDTAAPLEQRVRSYLDVNCAACHRPGGPSRGNFDARYLTPLAGQNLIHGELVAGDLGIPGARVVVPGHPAKSVLLQRLLNRDVFRMPPVAVNNEVQPITVTVKEWIEQMTGSGTSNK
jgi:glucose/arabinose dehydrogenase